MGVPASEMTQIQTDLNTWVLDKTCVIQRKSPTADAYGTSTPGYSTIATVSAGMTEPSASQLQNYAYLIGSLAAWHVRMPIGTNVRYQDHLIIETQTLEVQVVLEPHSYPGLLSVLASEVK